MGQEYLHSSHFASPLSFSFANIACLTNVMVLSVLWWIQGLGYVKAAITVIKYSPQVYINYKLQSTGAPHYHITSLIIHVRLGDHLHIFSSSGS